MKKRHSYIRKSERRKSSYIRSIGQLALGIAFGVLLVTAGYVSRDFFSIDLSRQEKLDFIPTALTLLVAFVSLLFSYYALSEQRKTRQAGTDPVILVHLDKREDARVLSTLEIRNVGAGAALDVHVKPTTDLSEFIPDRIITDFTRLHPIRTIPQDHSVSFNFGMGHILLKEPIVKPLEFSVEYKDIEGNLYSSTQTIDVRELGEQRADESLDTRVAKATESIAKSLMDSQSGHKPIGVLTQTLGENRQEQAGLVASLKKEMDK